METIQRWKPYLLPAAALLLFSFALVTYSAFSAGQYRWRSHLPPAAVSNLAAEGPGSSVSRIPTTLSHIVFGLGGSARTWEQRRGYTELWWRADEMRGHVWLDEEPVGFWPSTCPPYRVSANASRFGNRASASRMARIVAESYRIVEFSGQDPNPVRWFVMGDDDTVFFPENLVAVLEKYDHEEMYYIGAASESVEQDVMHSYGMAFGGGGFAISYPAAAELARVIEGCLDRYSHFYGSDQRIQSCLSELGIPLTREPGFHQVDLRGDAYGMLAAHPIAPLVSLHHLDYLQPVSPTGPTQIDAIRSLVGASRFDPARILQQTFCYESGPGFTWSASVSWGYTVQIYPWALSPWLLEIPLLTFQTWRSFSNGPFTFNTRVLSPEDPCERPVLFFLDRVRNRTGWLGGSDSTATVYARYKDKVAKGCHRPGFAAASKVVTVRVVAPKMDPRTWRRAPRRQCCKTRRTRGGRMLEVRINYCSRGEVTTPP
ncbi:uncharacterized protein [Typha latifolia]|uniref:uncharacterized protein isoform X2 n=1 Tax=Typha latifolia TaxID=4733 RepID=UPI003C2BD33C